MGLLPSWGPIMSTLDSFPLLQPLLRSALDTGFQLDQSLLILGLVLPFRFAMQWLPHAQKEDADNSAPSPQFLTSSPSRTLVTPGYLQRSRGATAIVPDPALPF